MSRYPLFSRDAIKFKPIAKRHSKLRIDQIAIPVECQAEKITTAQAWQFLQLIDDMEYARKAGTPIVLCMGAHPIKNGCCLLINEMIDRGWITHVAVNGAAAIHDWEFATFGKSTECVRTNIEKGEFGIWEETGKFFGAAASLASIHGRGWGETIGHLMSQNIGFCQSYRFKHYSIALKCYQKEIPFTIHPGIGQDIVYTHPSVDDNIGCAITDFLIFTETIRNLNDGVYLSVGSSIMSPMIFEKALSMARNVEQQHERDIRMFTIGVNDLQESSWDWTKGEPPMDHPDYYLRFYKTFYRMGGVQLYIPMDNRLFFKSLWHGIKNR